MKIRKINYLISIDSYWNEHEKSPKLPSFSENTSMTNVELVFEWDEKEDVMTKAEEELELFMQSAYPNKEYHIWYWDWID